MSQRPRLIATSLKMYLDTRQTLAWTEAVAGLAARHEALRSGRAALLVMPSLPVLSRVAELLAPTDAIVGAQDLFWEDRGAFTGAVSGADLVQIGCRFAEVGHAERRSLFAESDDIVKRKVAAAVRNGLTPLLCIGEPTQGPTEQAIAFCQAQLASALDQFGAADRSISVAVAYEPVWAIGQSQTASSDHIVAVSQGIKHWLGQRPGLATAPVIYGGSAAPGTLTALGAAVDGLFLGRFAHDPAALEQILDETLADSN